MASAAILFFATLLQHYQHHVCSRKLEHPLASVLIRWYNKFLFFTQQNIPRCSTFSAVDDTGETLTVAGSVKKHFS
jgi:hypothetical protein